MASNTLASRRLVLTLYRSLISAAAKYDKNIPSNRNPLFLIQREKDVHKLPEGNLSVRSLIREPFKNSIDTADEAKITLLVQEAFKNLRMLNQFYHPSLAWVQIFEKNSNSKDTINFANALKAISLFDLKATPSTLLDNSTSPSNSNSPTTTTIITPVIKSAEEISSSMSAQIDQIVARVHATIEAQKSTTVSEGESNETEAPKETETNPEMDQATNILKAISKVLYYEMGFTFSAARQPAKEQHLLTGLFASRNGSPTLLAALYVAIAQQMGLELYTAMCNNRTLLRFSKVGEHHLFHAEDVFVDATTGKVLVGLKLAATYARNANIVSSVSSNYLPMEHQSNVNLITKMLSALAGFHSQWKEHLTICHELARAFEVPKSKSSTSTASSEPTTSKTSSSTKSNKFEYTIRDSATPKTPPTPSSSSSSPSSSSSSSTTSSSSSSSSSTTVSSSTETSTSSSSSPSTTTAESTSSPSPSSSTTSKYGRYFNSLLSLLRRNKPTTHSPTAVSSTPSSSTSSPSPSAKSNTDDSKNQKDASNEKAEKGEKSEKSGEGQGKKKYSRMWSSSTDLYRNPKTRKF